METVIELELYIMDNAPDSQHALLVLNRLCDKYGGACRIRVIDVREDPEAALSARILVTPTLIRKEPAPIKRVIGRLHDEKQLMLTLEIEEPVPE